MFDTAMWVECPTPTRTARRRYAAPVRTLALTQNITLDGRIEMLDDWFDPDGPDDLDNTDLLEENRRLSSSADALLVGRRTFEDFRGYWRDLDDDPTGVSAYLNGVHKYVVTSTLTEADWEPTTMIDGSGDVAAVVDELKHRPGGDIVCTGSISLTHALLATRLVDELRLFVYPVVQGRGKSLFSGDAARPALELLASTSFNSGVVLLRYRMT